MMQEPAPEQRLAAIDDMRLAAYLVSHGLDIVRWERKAKGPYWWCMFQLTEELDKLRRGWVRSPEFMAFQVYGELLAQIKDAEKGN